MARDGYAEIPWTLQVPIMADTPLGRVEVAQLVDFDCRLSFLNGRLEGVWINLGNEEGELGDRETDPILKMIWNAAAVEYDSDSRLKYEVEDARPDSTERRVAAAEHRWEMDTGR